MRMNAASVHQIWLEEESVPVVLHQEANGQYYLVLREANSSDALWLYADQDTMMNIADRVLKAFAPTVHSHLQDQMRIEAQR